MSLMLVCLILKGFGGIHVKILCLFNKTSWAINNCFYAWGIFPGGNICEGEDSLLDDLNQASQL